MVDLLIEEEEFEDFFEAAYDPKKKHDLEKIYPRVKVWVVNNNNCGFEGLNRSLFVSFVQELVFKGLKGQGRPIFLKFIEKVGNSDFMPLSAKGQETFSILLGCIENDSNCFDTWRDNLAKYPRESAAFLSYLCKIRKIKKFGLCLILI